MTIAAPRRTFRRPSPRALIYFLLSLGLVITLAPFAWMLLGSIKPTGEILSANPNQWLPENPTLSNFTDLLAKQNFGLYFFNSVLVAVACAHRQLALLLDGRLCPREDRLRRQEVAVLTRAPDARGAGHRNVRAPVRASQQPGNGQQLHRSDPALRGHTPRRVPHAAGSP